MITREQAKKGPTFRVSYELDGNIQQEAFYSQEANDAFAASLPLMGVTDIVKFRVNSLDRWEIYNG